MWKWIGQNFLSVAVGIIILIAARWLFDYLARRAGTGPRSSKSSAFCNLCGWKGQVSKAKRTCGRCGSLKLTLRTG